MGDIMIQDVAALVPFHSQLKALGFKQLDKLLVPYLRQETR